MNNKYFYILFTLFGICFQSCNTKVKEARSSVKVRVEGFPSSINYLTSSSKIAWEIQKKTLNFLLTTDKKLNLRPLTAGSLPTIINEGSKYQIRYELRPEAIWDNGSPVTSEDIEFSLKVFKLPLQANKLSNTYFKRISEFRFDDGNTMKFSIVGEGNLEDLIGLTGDFGILQKAKFDPDGYLNHISLADIENEPEKVKEDSKAIKFLDNFILDNFRYNNEYFSSSGPYRITHVEDGQYISLTKNENWWGHSIAESYDYINANPNKITYYAIPETLTAIHSLREGDINVMHNIPANEFALLKVDKEFLKEYSLFSPLNFRFTYLGINSRNDILNKKRVRKAIAHLIDKSNIIGIVERGYAKPTIGPVNPALSFYFNNKIAPYSFNPNKAELLFTEVGFIKLNGKWYSQESDKPISFSVIYKQNTIYEAIAQILKVEAEKIGLSIITKSFDNGTVLKMKNYHNFDIYIGSLSGSPFSLDFSGLFGTDAAEKGGMNFTNFGNHKSDSLIRAINYSTDSIAKKDALFGLQEMLHDEATMIFLYFAKNKIAINRVFSNYHISSLNPGYDVTAFKLAEEVQ